MFVQVDDQTMDSSGLQDKSREGASDSEFVDIEGDEDTLTQSMFEQRGGEEVC